MSKGRILVVDDLPDWRTTLSGILFDEGYEVRAAGSREDALEMLQAEQFHLAVLDVRLDEQDEDNREGLTLMRQIKDFDPTIQVIILTGYADVRMVQEALRPHSDGRRAYSFVEKQNFRELLADIEQVFQEEIKINRDLSIRAEDDFLQQMPGKLRFTEQTKPPIAQLQIEIDELLRKLFYTCDKIILQPVDQGFSGAVVFRVEPHFYQRGQGEVVVTKIGEWPLIAQEEQNFDQAVQGIVGGNRLPQQLERTRTRSLGGLVYSFAGLGNPMSFIEFYTQSTPTDITPVLENLFLKTCFPWGRANKVHAHSFDFTKHYFEHLHLNADKLRRAYSNLFGKRHAPDYINKSNFRFLNQTLINPIEFILEKPLKGDVYLSPVHGDLTGYNVLLDHHLETWLIDFGRTGQGLLLQDFASFENFVKFSLLTNVDHHAFYEWENALVNTPALQPPNQLRDRAIPNSLSRMHQTILTVRQLAYQVSGNDHWREYLISLLFHALKLITIMNLKPIQRDLALVSAALICQQLKTRYT